MLLQILGAPWLGHGRMAECFLTVVAASYAILLLFPGMAWSSQATRDLVWQGWGNYVWMPFAILALLHGYGLLANIRAFPYDTIIRSCAAVLGMFIWFWYVAKFILVGEPATLGTIFAFWSIPMSIRIMALARCGLPRPGAPGAL